MKNIFLSILALVVVLSACNQKNTSEKASEVKKSEIVKSEQKETFVGDSFDIEEEIELDKLVNEMDTSDSLVAVVEVKVTEVCQKKGCWMKVDLPNGESMRITFKDYGFFVPKDLAGKNVKMSGIAKIEETDIETLKHYAEDAGKSEEEIALITEPKADYKFVATGVML